MVICLLSGYELRSNGPTTVLTVFFQAAMLKDNGTSQAMTRPMESASAKIFNFLMRCISFFKNGLFGRKNFGFILSPGRMYVHLSAARATLAFKHLGKCVNSLMSATPWTNLHHCAGVRPRCSRQNDKR